MKVCSVLNKVVSSAYIMGENVVLAKARSLIYIRKSSGPIMYPHVDIVYVVDLVFSMSTYCCLLGM